MLCHSTVAARLTANTEQKAQRVLLLYSLLPQLHTWDSCQAVGNGTGECKAAHQCVGLLLSKDVSMDLTPLNCFCNTRLCKIDVFSWLTSASTSLIPAWIHSLHLQQHLRTRTLCTEIHTCVCCTRRAARWCWIPAFWLWYLNPSLLRDGKGWGVWECCWSAEPQHLIMIRSKLTASSSLPGSSLATHPWCSKLCLIDAWDQPILM